MKKTQLVDKLSTVIVYCENRLDELKKERDGYLEKSDAIENNAKDYVYQEILDLITETPNDTSQKESTK